MSNPLDKCGTPFMDKENKRIIQFGRASGNSVMSSFKEFFGYRVYAWSLEENRRSVLGKLPDNFRSFF